MLKNIIKNVAVFLIVIFIISGCSSKNHIVTFNSDGGNKISDIIVKDGDKIELLSDPKKKGYTFLGWYLNSKPFNKNKKIDKNIELKALWGKNASNDSKNSNNDENSTIVYYCSDTSYELSNDKCKKKKSVKIEKIYYCDSGWALSGNKCSKITTSNEVIDATPIYTCTNQMLLNGNKCESHTIERANAVYYCPSGLSTEDSLCYSYTYKKTNSVTLNDTMAESIKISYVQTLRNNCKGDVKIEENVVSCWENVKKMEKLAETKWVCRDGFTLTNGACDKVLSLDAIVMVYNCPSGYSKSSSKCYKISSNTESKDAKYKNGCESGYTLNNDNCERSITINANKKVVCLNGYKLIDNKCQKN